MYQKSMKLSMSKKFKIKFNHFDIISDSLTIFVLLNIHFVDFPVSKLSLIKVAPPQKFHEYFIYTYVKEKEKVYK